MTESAMQADELVCPAVRGPHSGVTISGVSAIGWGWQMAAYQLDSLEQRIGVIGDVVASGIWMQIQRNLMDLLRKFYTGADSSPHPLFGGAFRVYTEMLGCVRKRLDPAIRCDRNWAYHCGDEWARLEAGRTSGVKNTLSIYFQSFSRHRVEGV